MLCLLFSLVLMLKYLGVNCLVLHVLLNQMAAFVGPITTLLLILLLLLLLLLLLVFSPWLRLGRDQSSVTRLVWLWYAAS